MQTTDDLQLAFKDLGMPILEFITLDNTYELIDRLKILEATLVLHAFRAERTDNDTKIKRLV